jgi:hypothetical protein
LSAHVPQPETVAYRTVRAVVLLVGASLRRMLREGLVVRSLVWPGLVTCTTLAATLFIVAMMRPGRAVGVPEDLDPALREALVAARFDVETVPDPAAAVRAGDVTLGTDGVSLWLYGTPPSALEIESILRTRLGASWKPLPLPLSEARVGNNSGDLVCRILGLLMVLYGLVFGLGGVARDRDDGSLDAELALPVPRWAGGLARWIASTGLLSWFYALSVLVFGALMPLTDPWPLVRHGTAATGTAVAIGLAVVGGAGIKQGFSGPFAVGMTLATSLAGLGGALGTWWLPIGSLFSGGSGWTPLALSAVAGAVSALLYGRRTGGTPARPSTGGT